MSKLQKLLVRDFCHTQICIQSSPWPHGGIRLVCRIYWAQSFGTQMLRNWSIIRFLVTGIWNTFKSCVMYIFHKIAVKCLFIVRGAQWNSIIYSNIVWFVKSIRILAKFSWSNCIKLWASELRFWSKDLCQLLTNFKYSNQRSTCINHTINHTIRNFREKVT